MNRIAREGSIVVNLAWRNLWRNHRRTLIMIAATTIAVWAMIFMTSLMRGMVNDMVRDGIESLPGHVQVHHPEFLDDPSIGNLIAVPDRELQRRFGESGIDTWSTRIKVPAMITSERATRGVTLFGVDPALDRNITFVADGVVDGRYLEAADDRGIVVGGKLLERLETDLGKRVVLMSQDPDNEIADRGYRIVGVFTAKLEMQEETLVFAGKETVRDMLGIGDFVTEIAIQGNDYRNVEPLRQQVAELVGGDAEVLSWSQLNSYLGSMLGVMDGFVIVWTVVIFLALSFGLVNTLVMAVFERVREIGLMLALGMRPRTILAQIVVESMMLLVIGLSLGTLLAWLTIVPLQDGIDLSAVAQGMEMFGASSVLYPELTLHDIVLSNAVVLVLGFFASLSPAVRASRYEPIEAITKV